MGGKFGVAAEDLALLIGPGKQLVMCTAEDLEWLHTRQPKKKKIKAIVKKLLKKCGLDYRKSVKMYSEWFIPDNAMGCYYVVFDVPKEA